MTGGVLTPPKDAAALGAAIAELLRQPERLAEMSVACRRIAVGEFDMELQGRHYHELYKTFCS